MTSAEYVQLAESRLSFREKVREFLGGWRRSNRAVSSTVFYYASLCFETLVILCIVGLVILSILYTEDNIYKNDEFRRFCTKFEQNVLVLFTIEYVLRLWSSADGLKGRLAWAIKPLSIVDLVALTSLYVDVFGVDDRDSARASTLRAFRGLRILLLFKMERQSRALRQLVTVFKARVLEITICAFLLLITVTLGSSIIYYFENPVQPNKFGSLLNSMYWAVVTVTTVGYGDMHPISTGGKLTASLLSCLGVLVIAIPSSLLSSSFVELLNSSKRLHSMHSLEKKSSGIREEDVDSLADHAILLSCLSQLEGKALEGDESAREHLLDIHQRASDILHNLIMHSKQTSLA